MECEMRKEGLHKWSGKAKDSKGCEFPYECYQSADYVHGQTRLYICPWWPKDKFSTLGELKAFVSKK